MVQFIFWHIGLMLVESYERSPATLSEERLHAAHKKQRPCFPRLQYSLIQLNRGKQAQLMYCIMKCMYCNKNKCMYENINGFYTCYVCLSNLTFICYFTLFYKNKIIPLIYFYNIIIP